MRIFLKRNIVKKYFCSLPRHISSLLVLVFLFASIGSTGASVFFSPPLAEAQGSEKAILHRHHPLVQEAIGVQHRHLTWLMRIPDVVGTGVGIGPDGLPVIKVFTARHGVRGIPEWLESIPVQVEVTGMIVALGNTTSKQRPAPIGVSTGHPDITAGTIGARVKDAAGNVYALSNNHVYANQNEAYINDIVLQPGTADGGVYPGDKIGTLYDFEPIDFTFSGENYIDAAVAISDVSLLRNSTLPDGYGKPRSQIATASNGLNVQKYGRTTGLTKGEVSAINSFVEVCYEQWWILCIKSAYFYDQVQISGSGFSGPGDSGSLIVTDDANKNPVGLLFAGSDTTTFANPIDSVLSRVGFYSGRQFTVDDSNSQPFADFSYTTSGLTASFTDKSTDADGTIISRSWDFGDGKGTSTLQNPTYSYTASGTYTIKLTATDDGNVNDTKTKTVSVGVTPPTAPTGLTATAVARNQINLSWTDNSNNETGFKIERCKGSSCTSFVQIATVGADATTYSSTGLNRNTWYRYRVRAYNAAGNSAYSNTASAKTLR
jgi:PKD repeat protein